MTGSTIKVRMVANPRPNITVTAMDEKKASNNNGIRPRIVVMAAIDTGLTRLTAESKQPGRVPYLPLIQD